MSRPFVRVAALGLPVFALLAGAAAARAQWTVTILTPAGSDGAEVRGVADGRQVGHAYFGGKMHACVWSGTAESWVDLHPAGASESVAYAASGSEQAGYAMVGGNRRACLWTGTAASRVDLHPAGAGESAAVAVVGGQESGWATFGGAGHAGRWSGSSASWVDLHPDGSLASQILGASADQQVGFAYAGFDVHAGVWTAGSFHDLNPGRSSNAFAVHKGVQAGSALVNDLLHAGTWSGTAESWVDLNFDGSIASEATAVFDGWQAGYAEFFTGSPVAVIWHGTAGSHEDLSAALVGAWMNSKATGIWSDGTTLYVVGWAYNLDTARPEALLWSRPMATCRPDCNKDGRLNVNDFICFQSEWRKKSAYGDYNSDGKWNINDFIAFQAAWRTGCP